MMNDHATLAGKFIADEERTDWHDQTLWWIRQKRDKSAGKVAEWETLRQLASDIKDHTLSRLDFYLEEFERNAIENGVTVHWAADAAEHNAIIHKIIAENSITRIVKSKSMLTEECHLNAFLAGYGLNVIDTDLGERIVQLRREPPSHIVLPAIHLKKQDVGDTFHSHLGTDNGNCDPEYLTGAARRHLREHLLYAELAITGVNFAIAETGGIVVCTNEGNADLGTHCAGIHVACMGIEKIIPGLSDLGVFVRLLARSATGQPITTYTSHFRSPRPGQQMHIVIVDNGRSRQLGRNDFRNSLKCIRCAACFNTCPVYRRSGGHSYHVSVGGPIGSILNPNTDMKANADLPFASTLCGSCSNVCPVKINIHEQLWKWRQEIVKAGHVNSFKKASMFLMGVVFSRPRLYRITGKLSRWLMLRLPFLFKSRQLNPWYKQREMPKIPKTSFRDWYIKNHKW